jgi:DeoR family lactose phosphotransferase system repressor
MERYIVTDHSKFNQIDFVPFYNVDELSAIITDDKIPEKTLKQYVKSINIINANTINNNL